MENLKNTITKTETLKNTRNRNWKSCIGGRIWKILRIQ